MQKFLMVIGGTVLVAACLILVLPISVLLGWITGVILTWFWGDTLVTGLNLLFNTTRFTVATIPYITATLSALTGFFIAKSYDSK